MMTFALIIIGCHKETETSEINHVVSITATTALDSLYSPVMNFSGVVSPIREANLGCVVPGKVERIFVPEGKEVQAGDLLALMSDELLTQGEIEFQAVEKDYQRISTLLERGSASQQDYDHIKALYEGSAAKLQMLRKNTEIRAPFSGVVMKHIVHEGENYSFLPNITPGQSLNSGIINLMQIDTVLVKVNVNEGDLTQIHENQIAEMHLNAYPEKVFTGRVKNIPLLVSTLSHSVSVEIAVENQGLDLRPGMYCTVRMEKTPRQGVIIPKGALLQQSGTKEQYVYVVEGNLVRRQIVTVIESMQDLVVIEGVTSGQLVAVEGKNKLTDGCSVLIVKGE